jgi:hypothetical protein
MSNSSRLCAEHCNILKTPKLMLSKVLLLSIAVVGPQDFDDLLCVARQHPITIKVSTIILKWFSQQVGRDPKAGRKHLILDHQNLCCSVVFYSVLSGRHQQPKVENH